jgi:transcriptional regulator with XRE-family HTH domain
MAGRSEAGPTALRIMLGTRLRRLRERAGVSRSEAGWAIRSSESKISRMELGRVGFKERDVADLLGLYEVGDAERDSLLQLARDANNRGWWHQYGDVTPDWFGAYLGLEAAAELIRTYEVQFVPGLLQTPEYARAVARLTNEERSEAEIDRIAALRITRQAVLDRDPALKLWAVIEESVLRRPIGGPDVHREQLVALLESIHRPNVTLQIIPLGSSGHAATSGAFSILRFPHPDLPDVVYVEQLTTASYLDRPTDVDTYTRILDTLATTGPRPHKAAQQITAILHDLD